MKTLTRTIIVIVALNLSAAGFVSAGNVSDEQIRAAVELQLQKADIAAVLAQASTSPPTAHVLPSAPTPANPPTPTPAPAPTAPTPPTLPMVNNNIYALTKGISYGSQTGGSGTVLVIPSGQTNTEDLLKINEDMNVMSRIFEKNIGQARISTGYGSMFVSRNDPFSMFMGGGRGGIQSIYLQGYGALFLMKVDFPLSPSPDIRDDEKETVKAEESDPVWQEMRREMYEPENVDRRRRTDRPEEKYDAEKVENLKTTLIKALKHAVNIRTLKQDESVILTIAGSGQAKGSTITAVTRSGENQIIVSERVNDGNMRTRIVQGTSLDDIGLSSPSILVIRTKKSDIDEFAKGDLDFDRFRQRVQLLTCPLLGGAAEHGDYGDYFDLLRRSRSTGSSSRR